MTLRTSSFLKGGGMIQPLTLPLQLKDMDWMIQGLIYLNRPLKIFRVEFPIEDASDQVCFEISSCKIRRISKKEGIS